MGHWPALIALLTHEGCKTVLQGDLGWHKAAMLRQLWLLLHWLLLHWMLLYRLLLHWLLLHCMLLYWLLLHWLLHWTAVLRHVWLLRHRL